jgi:hypothetical protein
MNVPDVEAYAPNSSPARKWTRPLARIACVQIGTFSAWLGALMKVFNRSLSAIAASHRIMFPADRDEAEGPPT